jgi:uncharacterized protein (TIGR02466 family)
MIETHSIFKTNIHHTIDVDLNLDLLYELSVEHAKKTPTVKLSNSGYQAHNFYNEQLYECVLKNIPRINNKFVESFELQSWINFNKFGDWNDIHTHLDDGVMLSGVVYIRAPENCGCIRLYDPRSYNTKLYREYFEPDQGNYLAIQPKPGMILLFPPGLHHSVEPNQSTDFRLSIAFNILNPKFGNCN